MTKVIDIFRSQYGDDYSYQLVYRRSFWSKYEGEIGPGDNIINLVCVDETSNEYMAHVAVKYYPGYPVVQCLLPIVHSNYQHRLFALMRAFRDYVLHLCQRQNINCIFQANLSSYPMQEMLAVKCFDSAATAFLPFGKPDLIKDAHTQLSEESHSFLVMTSNFLFPSAQYSMRIFPPDKYKKLVKEIYKPLKLIRAFGADGSFRLEEKQDTDLVNYGWDPKVPEPPLRVFYHGMFEFYQIDCLPSNAGDVRDTLTSIAGYEDKCAGTTTRVIANVALDSPLCPDLSDALVCQGYCCLGVLPMRQNHDYIVFARYNPEDLNDCLFYAKHTKQLRAMLIDLA